MCRGEGAAAAVVLVYVLVQYCTQVKQIDEDCGCVQKGTGHMRCVPKNVLYGGAPEAGRKLQSLGARAAMGDDASRADRARRITEIYMTHRKVFHKIRYTGQ